MEKLLALDASVALQAILPNPLYGYCRALVDRRLFNAISEANLPWLHWIEEVTSLR